MKSADSQTDTNQKTRQKIIDHFKEYYLEHGEYPGSVFKFSRDMEISEAEFYRYFGSFKGVEKEIWKNLMESTLAVVEKDKTYIKFNIREKLLAFYYTHLEVILPHRSFILLNFEKLRQPAADPYFLQEYKILFLEYTRALIDQGLESGEIANRKYITDHYERGFWVQLLFILRFWINDDSPAFEKSDAAVEKAVNLSFDLIGKGPVESMVDFAKFVLQNR